MTFATADLCDQFGDAVAVCTAQLLHFGANSCFSGAIATVRCLRDNGLIRAASRQPGAGRVLVVDAGGVLDCALVGGDLGANAAKNGWSGIVLYGCVRDLEELARLPIGIRALGVWPRRGNRDGSGQTDIPVSFGNATFTPGHWLCADRDGLVVMQEKP
ncbi:MAG TPA: ribonuclease E activity regulator RraA [Steroidobacteraceae bacterium]|nr:ribonuclease E activity regulator RraA [Steroidobacteraceae bacterium]HRX90358.1 ribonuclease E activity regulator RraA [Steroidobacteraceae bacterium]